MGHNVLGDKSGSKLCIFKIVVCACVWKTKVKKEIGNSSNRLQVILILLLLFFCILFSLKNIYYF